MNQICSHVERSVCQTGCLSSLHKYCPQHTWIGVCCRGEGKRKRSVEREKEEENLLSSLEV